MGDDGDVFSVCATRKLLDRVGAKASPVVETPGPRLGNWYATLLGGRPVVVLFVNEATLLPVLVPLAPSRTLLERLAAGVGAVLSEIGAPSAFGAGEAAALGEGAVWSKTANRSVVGVMNEFCFLARHWGVVPDALLGMSVRLAGVPCGPLYRSHAFPDRETLAAMDTLTAL